MSPYKKPQKYDWSYYFRKQVPWIIHAFSDMDTCIIKSIQKLNVKFDIKMKNKMLVSKYWYNFDLFFIFWKIPIVEYCEFAFIKSYFHFSTYIRTVSEDKLHSIEITLREQNSSLWSCLSSMSRICLWRDLNLSKEVLWVSVGQTAAKLQAVKLWGWSHCPGVDPEPPWLRPRGRTFFKSPTLTACKFDANWPTETQSTSLERSQPP